MTNRLDPSWRPPCFGKYFKKDYPCHVCDFREKCLEHTPCEEIIGVPAHSSARSTKRVKT